MTKDTVVDLCFVQQHSDDTNANKDDDNVCQACTSSCNIYLQSGKCIKTRSIVLTLSMRQPILPAWVKAADHPPALSSSFLSWMLPKNSNLQESIPGKHVFIVGGGMTAAQLAINALANQRASRVTLVARRPLLKREFECDVGWWGNRCLNSFWQEEDPENKLKMCRLARLQASIHSALWKTLLEKVREGLLCVLEGFEVENILAMRDGENEWNVSLKRTEMQSATRKQSMTDFQSAVGLHENTMSAASHCTVDDCNNIVKNVHIVWLACGKAFNASTHPLLLRIQQQCPTKLISGYPVIDQETCLWPGAPIYLAGRAAMLAVGPSAGDFAGMRLAAERIVKSLKRLGYAGEPEWQQAKSRLDKLLSQALPSLVAPSDSSENREVKKCLLALEEEGIMFVDHKPKQKVSRPNHLIDISDIDGALPRQEVQKFVFTDDDFEVCVILTLPEPIARENVRSRITERSLEIWAIGEQGAYRLYVPSLYGKVLPQRSSIIVKESKNRVIICLYKERDAEWRFLKS